MGKWKGWQLLLCLEENVQSNNNKPDSEGLHRLGVLFSVSLGDSLLIGQLDKGLTD